MEASVSPSYHTYMTTTSLADIHPDIIRTHILPRLDPTSLSTTATVSSHLNSLCSHDALWSRISRSTFPSTTHPLVHDVITSTFPHYRSFFHDSFPTLHLIPHSGGEGGRPPTFNNNNNNISSADHQLIISAVDIRYQMDDTLIYSGVKFTDIHQPQPNSTCADRSPTFQIQLHNHEESNSNMRSSSGMLISQSPILGLTVDEIAGADAATVSHLKQSVTLNWILMDPVRKRACNLSSVKAVSARGDWVTNETHLRYVTVLPGAGSDDEMVQCKIHVVLGVVGTKNGLQVKDVRLKMKDVGSRCLSGMEFLVVARGAMAEENDVRRRRRKTVEERWKKSYREFKERKRGRKEGVKRKERTREVAGYVAFFVSCFVSFYLFLQ